ncbi:hypothetical protein HK44_002860 [Pseudomonas fluorescens HK44]|uniref:Uncharacterized protein n=1 Tax=Pseudomonas fluorescens HK44 TaxID=1042209 RepID=A0A010T5A5_PSEFL|nr:hypothetical protein [Pseudomonas fluorescens]EXF92687.1 hypothetical protein HK44_002860 [Pseudomonas fluorescens HK44]
MPTVSLTANQQDFADYLEDLWSPREFPLSQSSGEAGSQFALLGISGIFHCYEITNHRAWAKWRAKLGDHPTSQWWCSTLEEAYLNYSWPEKPVPDSFQCIAQRLRQGLSSGSNEDVRDACLDIFEWGGVARKPNDSARVWVNNQADMVRLCDSIRMAVEFLQPGCASSLAIFDGQELLMNSAMTKVYAAADPLNIIMYDGRVGAALGLLTRYWLQNLGSLSVPADLSFRWGPKRGAQPDARDPSLGVYKFKSLYQPAQQMAQQNQSWAELVRSSGGILGNMASSLNNRGVSVTIDDIQRALFMIGYNVKYPCAWTGISVSPAKAPTDAAYAVI